MNKLKLTVRLVEIVAVISAIIFYGIPFYYVIIGSLKSRREAGLMQASLPEEFMWSNYKDVIQAENYAVLDGFKNSLIITVFAITIIILVCGMIGFVLQRRRDKITTAMNLVVLTGLMIPTAIVPTIWVMQTLNVYKTLFGMILVFVALNMSFGTILFRGFMGTIPRELDEAAVIDGCGPLRLFLEIIFPLIKPVTATIIAISSVTIFNDFVHPLYFLPGRENITVQTTLYYFMGMYQAMWHYLFADVVIISIPPLLAFIFFNKKIVSGLVAGAVKG